MLEESFDLHVWAFVSYFYDYELLGWLVTHFPNAYSKLNLS